MNAMETNRPAAAPHEPGPSREYQLDQQMKLIIRKIFFGTATDEDRMELRSLQSERAERMMPQALKELELFAADFGDSARR